MSIPIKHDGSDPHDSVCVGGQPPQAVDFVRLSGIPITEIPEATMVLMLWTEKGAARHAKMLSTEKAWEVFEELEDGYFRLKQSQALENLTPELARQIGGMIEQYKKYVQERKGQGNLFAVRPI